MAADAICFFVESTVRADSPTERFFVALGIDLLSRALNRLLPSQARLLGSLESLHPRGGSINLVFTNIHRNFWSLFGSYFLYLTHYINNKAMQEQDILIFGEGIARLGIIVTLFGE